MNDFILICQGPRKFRVQALRNMFNNIDNFFRPNAPRYIARKEPISLKKISQGDESFTYNKKILCWLIYTIKMNLKITRKLQEKALALFHNALINQCSNINIWYRLFVTLRSISTGIQGVRGLFSILKDATPKHKNRILITQHIIDVLQLWE